MDGKRYYSIRTGKHPNSGKLDLSGLKRLVVNAYQELESGDYFQEAFGFECVDQGFIKGYAGEDVEAFFFRKLLKSGLWPIEPLIDQYTEDDLFDVIELLHDCASKGVDGGFHSWGNCGWHYNTFDRSAGQNVARTIFNPILENYNYGYQITSCGEIIALAPKGLEDLDEAPTPPGDPSKVQARLEAARRKFRRRGISFNERRDAVRDLADILEYLRPQAKKVLQSKDEDDLFNLANNFGIRHHNSKQKTNYDSAIWLSWMFYYYLATIHAVTRLIERESAD